ncbi:DUF4167 domain-containing protein [Albidovulum sp.]
MRSSKNRSRSKSNRQRSLGNIINRVFDSSGPEGKVRGTPQQIIDKYLALARDAQLSNDRVAEQNFLQHAEHYTRLLAEAQREMQREQEARQQHHQQQQPQQQQAQQAADSAGEARQPDARRPDPRQDRPGGEAGGGLATADGAAEEDDGPGLVETPESRHRRERGAPMIPEMPAPEAEPGAAKKSGRGGRRPRRKGNDAENDAPADKTPPADAAE